MVHGQRQVGFAVLSHGLLQERRVIGLLHCLQDERWVGGRVLRAKLGELQKVTGVGHHGGQGFEGVELVHGMNYPM